MTSTTTSAAPDISSILGTVSKMSEHDPQEIELALLTIVKLLSDPDSNALEELIKTVQQRLETEKVLSSEAQSSLDSLHILYAQLLLFRKGMKVIAQTTSESGENEEASEDQPT